MVTDQAVRVQNPLVSAPGQDEVLGLTIDEFVRVAQRRIDGVLVDARIEGLSTQEAVNRLLLLSSIDVRKVALESDYGRDFPHDDH
jgi:hypothetical protein